MDQLDPARIRPGRAQAFDDPEIESAAAVHRPSGRLVQRDQSIVFVEDRPLDGLPHHLSRCLPRPGLDDPHRRDPHDVAGSQTVVLPHPAPVDPHLATTQQPVDPGAWNALETGRQEVVDALPGSRRIHDDFPRCFQALPGCQIHREGRARVAPVDVMI